MDKHPHTHWHGYFSRYSTLNVCVSLFPLESQVASWFDRDVRRAEPDQAEVHLPMGMKSDVHNMFMDEVRHGDGDLQPVSDIQHSLARASATL